MHRVGVWLCSFLLLPIALLDGGTARAVERAFPSTPILDDFDRPDEPSPGGPGWVASVSEQFPLHEGLVVSDNKAASSSLTESASSSWTTEFPQDQEAYFEYGDTPGPNAGMGPAVRLQDPADLESDQYLVFFYQVAFEGRSVVRLWKRSEGIWSQLTDKDISTDLVQGDQIGIRAVGDRIEAFLNGEVVSSYVDPDPILQPGYIQLYVGDDVGHTAVNFGGGAVADDLPALLSPVQARLTVAPGSVDPSTGERRAGRSSATAPPPKLSAVWPTSSPT